MINGKEVCETFNNFFSTVGPKLAGAIPQMYHCSPAPFVIPNNNQIKAFTPCHKDELLKIIDGLDPNCSVGIDGISTKVIKCIKNLIADDLARSINYHFNAGNFPDSLKIAKVTPIFKSGSKTDPNNYRPISVPPVISKIFERVIYTRLNEYLTSINFLSSRQYGSVTKCYSLTQDALSVRSLNRSCLSRHRTECDTVPIPTIRAAYDVVYK